MKDEENVFPILHASAFILNPKPGWEVVLTELDILNGSILLSPYSASDTILIDAFISVAILWMNGEFSQ
ncbi:MAG TPA: hypothetical protein VFQ13_19380 [Anaerolineales bacterium]|nr:hypothetical protein [Anaerolineales bacterium]